MTMESNVVKFPSGVSRKAHSRKPRKSKNGTPEERAAKAAQERTGPPADVHFIGKSKLDLWSEAVLALGKLGLKERLPEAVKCLQLLLTKNVSATALLVRQRGASKSDVMSGAELQKKVERLNEHNQQYIMGYMQGSDRRAHATIESVTGSGWRAIAGG
jgi:hypothetical protein